MKTFHWTLLALLALVGALGAYAVSGDFALQVSSASVVDLRIDCPDDLAQNLDLSIKTLPKVDRVLQANSMQLDSVEILVDRAKNQPDRADYAFNLRTPDGNLIVSRNHSAPYADLDRALAARIDQAVRDYQRIAQEHGLEGKGVVVENF